MKYKITIPGRPVPKGRPRATVKKGKAFLYTPIETREYEQKVGWSAKAAGCGVLDGVLSVKIDMYLRGRMGDIDNYCKSILDGLNGVAWEDDRQINVIGARKHRV